MDIGSAKIMPEEMQKIKHYLVDELLPTDEFHIVKFQEMAKAALEEIYSDGKIPIIVGGTGFYIQGLLYDIDFSKQDADYEYRMELEAFAKEHGAQALHERLRKIDPVSYETIHANNIKRVIRALEYYHLSGKPISEHNEQERQKESPYHFAYFVLNDDRKNLYDRIEKRIDVMMEQGLLEEVTRLKQMGCHKDMVSMQGLGYKEILAYLDGEYSLEAAVDLLKKETRHFAKRQLTWFRRERDVIWFDKSKYSYDERMILEDMCKLLEEKQII